MVEYILSGFIGVTILSLVIINWHGNRNKNVTLLPLDLNRTPSLLRRGKHIIGHYRGYPVRLHIFKSYAATELTLDPRNSTPVVLLPNPDATAQKVIEDIAQRLSTKGLQEVKGEIFVATKGCRIIYTQPGIEMDKGYLQFLLDLLIEMIEVYPQLAALGGEVVPSLVSICQRQAHPLRMVAPHLLRDIQLDTTARLGANPSKFLCKRCLVRCAAHKIPLSSGMYARFYGCRKCGQSREVVEWKKKVIVVLDRDMTQFQILKDGLIRGNWFIQRGLFDFDEVEILKATDEEVERFSVQVGNDTDEIRQSKYRQMRCLISPNCNLSPNSLKVLQSTFGKVEVVKLV